MLFAYRLNTTLLIPTIPNTQTFDDDYLAVWKGVAAKVQPVFESGLGQRIYSFNP